MSTVIPFVPASSFKKRDRNLGSFGTIPAPVSKNSVNTERLILRAWSAGDFEAYAAMVGEAEVMQFLSADARPLSRWDAWSQFSAIVGHWQLRGFGVFAVIEKSTGEIAGRVGTWQPEGWPVFEISWTLRRKYWGKGYATEAAEACLMHSFIELRQDHIYSFVGVDNVRSIRVAERIGQHLEGNTSLPHMPDGSFLKYGISFEDWQKRHQVSL